MEIVWQICDYLKKEFVVLTLKVTKSMLYFMMCKIWSAVCEMSRIQSILTTKTIINYFMSCTLKYKKKLFCGSYPKTAFVRNKLQGMNCVLSSYRQIENKIA